MSQWVTDLVAAPDVTLISLLSVAIVMAAMLPTTVPTANCANILALAQASGSAGLKGHCNLGVQRGPVASNGGWVVWALFGVCSIRSVCL